MKPPFPVVLYAALGFFPTIVMLAYTLDWISLKTVFPLIGIWFLLLVICGAVETIHHQRELKRTRFMKKHNINLN